jgi:hypothetical protein
LLAGKPSSYASAHRRLATRPLVMSSLLLLLDKFPWLRKHALQAFAGDPKVFEGLLAVHAGSRMAPALSALGCCRLLCNCFVTSPREEIPAAAVRDLRRVGTQHRNCNW